MMMYAPDPDPPAIMRSPIVTDTLAVLVGGMPETARPTGSPKELRGVLRGGGAYYRPARGEAPDSIGFIDIPEDPATQRALVSHEFGHAFDHRGTNPDLVRSVTRRRPNRGSYAATSKREHFAEAFARGVDAMSATAEDAGHLDALVEALDRMTPGTKEVVGWLRGHPLYDQHPARRSFLQHLAKD